MPVTRDQAQMIATLATNCRPIGARHYVTIRKSYTNGDRKTPYKWEGECTCGWNCLSWAWSRAFYAEHDPTWPADDTKGGALPMALEHHAEMGNQ